ncbi:enoyl-CoA hydratase/isomerase family protein [Xanthobacter sediminis]
MQVTIADGIGEIRFNRPAVLNALDLDTAMQFDAMVDLVTTDPAVRVIVLAAEGRAFMAGGDLAYFRDATNRAAAAAVLIDAMHAPLQRLSEDPRPVLASLKGPVAGGGLGVALAADLAIAADDVTFAVAYLAVAASPDCSTSWNLVQLLGLRKAMELALLGESVNGAEALRLGLINRLVPGNRLQEETHALARRLAAQSAPAMSRTKALLRAATTNALQPQLDAERRAFVEGAATADFDEALDAFFAKRKPQFSVG